MKVTVNDAPSEGSGWILKVQTEGSEQGRLEIKHKDKMTEELN